jgi:hypothetical protein
MATCTNLANWASVVNHHNARDRSEATLCALSAQMPAIALPMMTTHENPV